MLNLIGIILKRFHNLDYEFCLFYKLELLLSTLMRDHGQKEIMMNSTKTYYAIWIIALLTLCLLIFINKTIRKYYYRIVLKYDIGINQLVVSIIYFSFSILIAILLDCSIAYYSSNNPSEFIVKT